MSSAAGSSAPPPPPGGGPGKGFGPSHNISKTNIPRNGDGSSAQTAKFSITLERNPAQQPQFVIRPVSRLEPWIRTNEAEARYAAESGQQVFHGHNGQPVTAWTPPLRGVQPNTAFYAHNEMTVKVEQGFAASGEYLGEEDVLGTERSGGEEPDASFGGSVVSSGTTGGMSSFAHRPASSGGGRSTPGRVASNVGSPVRSPVRSSPRSQPNSPRSPTSGPAFGAAGAHSRQGSGTVSTPRRRGDGSNPPSSPLNPGSGGSGTARSPKNFQGFEDMAKSPSDRKGKGRDFGSGDRSGGGGGSAA